MSYRARISRAHPDCILFLVDQSAFMADVIAGGQGKTKCEGVAETINRLIQTLSIRCSWDEGVKDYYDVGLIGYCANRDGKAEVGPVWGGPLSGRELIPISEVAFNPQEVREITKRDYDDAGGVITKNIKLPIWLEPRARGGAPLCEALRYCQRILTDWIESHPDSFPPIVFHIAGGEATDGDPEPEAAQLTSLATRDGQVLLFNCLVSSRPGDVMIFCDYPPEDEYLQMLFRISSELPPAMLAELRQDGFQIGGHARAFVFNADLVSSLLWLPIGTRITPYCALVSTKNPGCIFFLIDQSGAMADPYGRDERQSKAQVLAENVNRLLRYLVLRCLKDEEVHDYLEVGVIGYREARNAGQKVGPAFLGSLVGRDLVPISEVAVNPVRVDELVQSEYDEGSELVNKTYKVPLWFDPVAEGGTPMGAAFRYAQQILDDWVRRRPASFPPIVFHLTSGEATDGDALPDAERMKSLGTRDGEVLLFNCHVSSSKAGPIVLPDKEEGLQDETAGLLFRMSSELPLVLLKEANKEGWGTEHPRCFTFNAHWNDLVIFLDIAVKIDADT